MKVVLSYSGGLDTSAILVLLKSKGYRVITVTVDVGQEDELNDVEKKAYMLGSEQHYTIDAIDEFADKYISTAIMANALYEGNYPLGTALARPLIAEKVAEIALEEGADAVAHGCTGKGNDQVRFDTILRKMLGDTVEIITPVRDIPLTREKSIEILKEHGYDPGVHKEYSIDENLWTRSIEGGILDDAGTPPPEEVFSWTRAPEKAPETPLLMEVEFSEGIPISVNGEKMNLSTLIRYLNRKIGLHGYGRIDHVENRIVGLKSREIYEAPAALALISAHRDLEKTVLTPLELRFKQHVDMLWSDLVYSGLWIEPLRETLDKIIIEMNRWVSGTVLFKVYKGNLTILARKAYYSSYDSHAINYDTGWYPTGEEARGFVKIFSMHSIAASNARKPLM